MAHKIFVDAGINLRLRGLRGGADGLDMKVVSIEWRAQLADRRQTPAEKLAALETDLEDLWLAHLFPAGTPNYPAMRKRAEQAAAKAGRIGKQAKAEGDTKTEAKAADLIKQLRGFSKQVTRVEADNR